MRCCLRLFVLAACMPLLFACKAKHNSSTETSTKIDSIARKDLPLQELKPIVITYHKLLLTDSVLKNLSTLYDSTQLKIILSLNRIDLSRLRRSDSLVIPDTLATDLKIYSPFPTHVPALDAVHKILLCAYPVQAFGAYEQGNLVRWGPVSMGKQSTPTPTGLFHTNWKSKQTASTDNAEWILNWYFNLVSETGVSLHQYELPGFPASHSCVRLKDYDAYWIYHWAEQWKLDSTGNKLLAYGTPVVIFGSYRFHAPPPRYKLLVNSHANDVSVDSLTHVLQPYLPAVLRQQAQRDSLLQARAAMSVLP